MYNVTDWGSTGTAVLVSLPILLVVTKEIKFVLARALKIGESGLVSQVRPSSRASARMVCLRKI